MSRFAEPQDPVFQELNASIGFDWRLGPYDVAQSRAHAAMLAAQGIISDADRDALLAALDAVERELDEGRFPFAPDDEDIHMAIERRVTELAGPVGGKLHTARSRNDQVATDVAMFVRAHAARAAGARSRDLMAACSTPPRSTSTGRCPATPTCSARSPSTSRTTCSPTSGCSPATASALPSRCAPGRPRCRSAPARWPASTSTPTARVARELGFGAVAENSIDAVSNRDFVLDYLAAAATCATHLSRLGAEIVLWSSEEFGFCEVADAFASGSSIMPQKKNPDAAELLRAKAPRIAGHLVALHGVLHGLPLTYNKDMQEDKEHLFDARRHARAVPGGGARDARGPSLPPRAPRRSGVRTSSSPRPTSPTCSCAAGCRSARRTGSSPAWCAPRLEPGARCRSSRARSSPRSPICSTRSSTSVLAGGRWLESKVSEGGTALARVREQLEQARAALAVSARPLRGVLRPAGRWRSPAT